MFSLLIKHSKAKSPQAAVIENAGTVHAEWFARVCPSLWLHLGGKMRPDPH